MVWLYLPESLGLTSEYDSPSHLREPFVMSRGKPMPLQSLCRKWKKEDFMKHLYGLTLSPSTANLGVERWISSLEDSLVNPGQKRENSRKLKMKDGFGSILKESFARLDLNTSSWKMFQASLTGEYLTFSNRWPRQGTMLNGVVSGRRKLAQTIKETGHLFSPIVPKEDVLFPTMTVMDSTQDGSAIRSVAKESLERGGWRGISLPLCVRMFPTPIAADSVKTNLIHQGGNPTLLGAVQMFPTPTLDSAQERKKKYSQGGTSLSTAVQMFPTPTTIDNMLSPSMENKSKGHQNLKMFPTPIASESMKAGKTSLQESLSRMALREELAPTGGKLNPQWVEWLMGWPIGWTDLEHVGTESFPSRLESLIPSSSKEQLIGGV